jgi:acyl-CoA thioester hydrolase
MRFAHHAKYFEYFEYARTEMLRDYGLPYNELERQGYLIPVLEAYARFRRPAYYDELLRIVTYIKEVPNFKFRLEYEVYRDSNDELIAEGYTEHVFLDGKTYKPMKPPENFIRLISERLKNKSQKMEAEKMLKKELLEILACPRCKGDLDYNVEKSQLTCKECGKVYQVKDGIPIMLVDDEEES